MIKPHWERGHRCHGYWLGPDRIGFIGLSQSPTNGYSWSYEPLRGPEIEGHVLTLRAAKRAVENLYRKDRCAKNKG